MNTKELEELIFNADAGRIAELWGKYRRNEGIMKEVPPGKALEFIILRAFDLEIQKLSGKQNKEIGYVKYPFDVKYPQIGSEQSDKTLEQIDGVIMCEGLYTMVEFKDYSDTKISVEPLSKLRNLLERRHGSVFGMFFSATEYTLPAIIQVQFMAPRIIILWSIKDMDFCIKRSSFIDCMKWKYSKAIEECEYYADYETEITYKEKSNCEPLF